MSFSEKPLLLIIKILKIMQTLQTPKATKNKGLSKIKTSPAKPQKKSLWELIMQNIPDGKYEGLSSLLEPHEIPNGK